MGLYGRVRRAVLVEGRSQRTVAREFGVSRKMIRKMLAYSVPPGYRRQQPARRPKLGPWLGVIDAILKEDKTRPAKQRHTAKRIFQRLKEEHGFAGQSRIVRDWIGKHCGSQRCRAGQQPSASTPRRSSPRQVAWLLLKQPEDARSYLEELCRRSPEIATCASLAREFCRIIRQRDGSAWLRWRDAAPASPLANFAKHLCRDEEAVLAALQQPWSNGPPSRRACSPTEADQTLHVRPSQLRLATLACRKCHLNSKPTQERRSPANSSSNVRKNHFYSATSHR